jgi:acyl-CoA synthetase (AMP-forming)/AMP-acid ligase II
MNTPTKRRIAKELIAFLGCFLLGIVVIPLIVSLFDANTTYQDILDSFFVNPQLGAWLIAVSPYTFYLLMRSIV